LLKLFSCVVKKDAVFVTAMTKPKTPPPQIEEVKLSDLLIDNIFSGRSEKEIQENSNSLSPLLEAAGAWDALQPGKYFERDGKKHLAAGFTRVAAALKLGWKTGFFGKIADEPEKLRTECIRTNLGKPISPFEQGRIYTAMRDGSDPETLAVGEVGMGSIPTVEIALSVGYTRQHVEQCITVFESTPEIAELILAGKVAPGIVIRAKQLVKDDAKRFKFLQAAVKEAESDGKETATKKHLDAVRPDFAPLKAAGQAPLQSDEDSEPSKLDEVVKRESPEELETDEGEGEGESELPGIEATADNSDQKETTADKFGEIITKWGNDRGVVFSDSDRESLVTELIAVPF